MLKPVAARRRFLLGAGLAGGALMVAGCSDHDDAKDIAATEDLMREHGVLRRVLIVYRETADMLRKGTQIDAKAIATAATLFRDFGETYHERMLEEQFIFPEMRKEQRLAAVVDVLQLQHQRGREVTEYIIGATREGKIEAANAEPLARAMDAMVRMYESHATREDTDLFPAWRKSLSGERLNELSGQFESIEKKQFGTDGFESAVQQIASVEQALNLADLGQFTLPPLRG
jgi:hemerythrin-like domain-containing protein